MDKIVSDGGTLMVATPDGEIADRFLKSVLADDLLLIYLRHRS